MTCSDILGFLEHQIRQKILQYKYTVSKVMEGSKQVFFLYILSSRRGCGKGVFWGRILWWEIWIQKYCRSRCRQELRIKKTKDLLLGMWAQVNILGGVFLVLIYAGFSNIPKIFRDPGKSWKYSGLTENFRNWYLQTPTTVSLPACFSIFQGLVSACWPALGRILSR